MAKAIYLLLVYLLPLFSLVIPVEHFQSFWLWVYFPVGALYFTFVWMRPHHEMMMWVTMTPIVTFLSLEVVAVVWGLFVLDVGNQLLSVLLLVTLVSFVGAVIIGSGYLLLAYGLFALLRGNDWLRAESVTARSLECPDDDTSQSV